MSRRITDRGGLSSPHSREGDGDDDGGDSIDQARFPLRQEQHQPRWSSLSRQPRDDDETLIELVAQAVATKTGTNEDNNLVISPTRCRTSNKDRIILDLTGPTNNEAEKNERTGCRSDNRANAMENSNDSGDSEEEEDEESQSIIVRGAFSEMRVYNHAPAGDDGEAEEDEQCQGIPMVFAVPVLNDPSNDHQPTVRDNNDEDFIRQLLLQDIESVTAIPLNGNQEGRIATEEIHLLQQTVYELHSRLQEQDELVQQLRASLEALSSSTTTIDSTVISDPRMAVSSSLPQHTGTGTGSHASSSHKNNGSPRGGLPARRVISVSCVAVCLGAIVVVGLLVGRSSGTASAASNATGTMIPTEPPKTDYPTLPSPTNIPSRAPTLAPTHAPSEATTGYRSETAPPKTDFPTFRPSAEGPTEAPTLVPTQPPSEPTTGVPLDTATNSTMFPTEPPVTNILTSARSIPGTQTSTGLGIGVVVAIVAAAGGALFVLGVVAAMYHKRRAMPQQPPILPMSESSCEHASAVAPSMTDSDARQHQQQRRQKQEAAAMLAADLNKALTNRAKTARQLRAVYLKTKSLSSAAMPIIGGPA